MPDFLSVFSGIVVKIPEMMRQDILGTAQVLEIASYTNIPMLASPTHGLIQVRSLQKWD
jgi:hypothetical protein